MTPADLAELMSAFNEVTGRLERTHENLQREVVRLNQELREANEALQRSRRLAALGEMAAGIAHEVRNPLGSIGLYAHMLEEDLADRPAQRATAAKISQAVRGLNAVVGDVLSFAREVRIEPGALDGRAVLERAAEVCLAESPLRPRVEVRARAGVIWADPLLLSQALVNIVRNALQAMQEAPAPEGGHVLRLESRTLPSGEALVEVVDTGPGVDDRTLERMFNPFFTTRKTGTGLGLAIVHRIVDAHRGRVLVRNTPAGRGAVFQIVLPGRPAASPPPPPPSDPPLIRSRRAGKAARALPQEASA
jgi:two-component system sensor histidine kinase HydH